MRPVELLHVDTRQADMRQVDAILAKFPGPVTLHITRTRRIVGLVFSLCVTALFAWFWIANPGPRYHLYDWSMLSLGVLIFAGFTIRAMILLISPASASMTLDANGFEIGQVFRSICVSWRNVSDFRVELTYRRYELWQVVYDVPGARRRGVVPEFYGRPRLHGEVLVRLMNEWRQRALALPPETSVPIVPQTRNSP